VCGVDEVGVGAIAGPVVAGAVVLDPRQEWTLELRDSKALSPKQRADLYAQIVQFAPYYATATVGPLVIDEKGIAYARLIAMTEAYSRIDRQLIRGTAFGAVVDGRFLAKHAKRFGGEASLFVDHADARSLSVAAASIIAKVQRDDYMTRLAEEFPEYGFEDHRGYPSPRHLEVLTRLGPTAFHRRSFGPVARVS